jgi:hypothetical protein
VVDGTIPMQTTSGGTGGGSGGGQVGGKVGGQVGCNADPNYNMPHKL